MKTKLKSSILLIALTALMFVNIGAFTTAKSDTPKTSAAPALTVGTEQSFSFTNDSQIKAYRINWTADKIYKLSLTNDKGCSLKAKVWYPDSKKTYNIPVFYGENEYGSYLPNIDGYDTSDMGVTSSTEWNQTTEDFYFKTFMNLSVIIHIYSDARNNSIAYEDLGGKVKVSDATASLLDQSNTDITAGWSSSITDPEPGFKYKKVFLNETGLYQFELTSTANDTAIDISAASPAYVAQNYLYTIADSNDTNVKTFYSYPFANDKKFPLPAGTLFLKAFPAGGDDGCSWDLTVSKITYPIVPHNGSTSFSMSQTNALNYTGMYQTFFEEKSFIINNLEYDTLYDYSVECPDGYDIRLFDPRMNLFFSEGTNENVTESGEFLVSPNTLPMYQNLNGYDIPNSFRFLYGHDRNPYSDNDLVERFYGSSVIPPGQGFIMPNGTNYYILMTLWFFNTSANWEDQSISFSVDIADTQPEVLNDASTTYTFNHISDNDDEGIYKLNTNHTGNVLGFLMSNMGDNASVSMSAFSNRFNDELGLDLGVMGEGGFSSSSSYSWNNDTYEDNNYDKYWREIALLSDGYVILQDPSTSNSFPYQNTTQFTMKYDVFPAVNLSQEFTKQRGRDLVLLRAEMDYNTSIHAHGVSGIPNLDENAPSSWESYFGFTEDGVYQVATSEYGSTGKDMTSWFASMKDTYYMPIIMDTSDGRTNIGTFKFTSTGTIPDVTGIGAIPGYPIFVTLTISVFVIGIIAYLQRKHKA